MSLLGSSNPVQKSRASRPRQERSNVRDTELGPRRLKAINATLLEGHVGAGAYRNTNLVNGASELASTPGWEVSRQEARIFTALEAENYLQGLQKEQFISRLAAYRTAFIKWGPFHGANQRSADMFLEEVAQRAGYQVNMNAINQAQLKTATAAAVLHDELTPLRSLLRQHTKASRAVAFDEAIRTGNRSSALDSHPELKHAFSIVDRGLGGDPKAPQSALNSPRQDARLLQRVRSELEAGRLTREFSSKERTKFFSRVRELERAAR